MDKELFGIVFLVVFFFGGLRWSAHNSDTKQRECRIELAKAKELKLDPANILLICEGK